MRILVAYASRFGSTAGIAERIGAILRQQGLDAAVVPVETEINPDEFDAAIVGSAAYFGRWLSTAANFVRRHQQALANRPLWLFSSGPLGLARQDSKGRDLCDVAAPHDFREWSRHLHPRGCRVFFGRLNRETLPAWQKFIIKLMGHRAEKLLPEGDFRNWLEIESWAREIADGLKTQTKRLEPSLLQVV